MKFYKILLPPYDKYGQNYLTYNKETKEFERGGFLMASIFAENQFEDDRIKGFLKNTEWIREEWEYRRMEYAICGFEPYENNLKLVEQLLKNSKYNR